MVGAVVEQVYSSMHLQVPSVKNTRNMSPETLNCTSKCTKNAFVGRAAPGPAGEHAALPQTL